MHTRIRRFNSRDTYPEQQLDNDLCQAVVARGSTVFVRGQVGQDLETSESVSIGDPVGQAERAMSNVVTLLEEAGARLEHVCKITIYLTDPRFREPGISDRWPLVEGCLSRVNGLGCLRSCPPRVAGGDRYHCGYSGGRLSDLLDCCPVQRRGDVRCRHQPPPRPLWLPDALMRGSASVQSQRRTLQTQLSARPHWRYSSVRRPRAKPLTPCLPLSLIEISANCSRSVELAPRRFVPVPEYWASTARHSGRIRPQLEISCSINCTSGDGSGVRTSGSSVLTSTPCRP